MANPSLFLLTAHVVYGSPPKDTDCRTIPELNAANFMNDLKIIKNVNSIKNATIEEIMANEELYVIPKPQVCINLGTTERVVCVNVNENEALPEITKVRIKIFSWKKLGPVSQMKDMKYITFYDQNGF